MELCKGCTLKRYLNKHDKMEYCIANQSIFYSSGLLNCNCYKPILVNKMENDVAHQAHYESMKIQPIQFMAESLPPNKFMGFLEGNVIKYICRADKKNGLGDLKKARVYLNWLIEYKESGKITV